MKKIFLGILILSLTVPAFAKTIAITVTDEEIKAVEGIVVDAKDWLQAAWNSKASKCMERVILLETDKNPSKMSKESKSNWIKNNTFKTRKEKDKENVE
jgi:hypothetical protein